MSPHQSRKLKIAAAWMGVALGGAIVGVWNYRAHESDMILAIVRGATRAAIGFDAEEMLALDPAQPNSAPQRAVTARLRKYQAVDPRLGVLYVLRFHPDTGKFIYLAHSSEAAVATGQLGREYQPMAGFATLQAVLRTGEAAMEGPWPRDGGQWMMGWAMIEDSAASLALGRHVLGLELTAAGWRAALWRAGFQGAFYVWILLGLPLAAWLVLRRQHEQREVIRNLSEAMEQSHSAIVILDLECRVEYANRGLCQQIGYSRRDLIGLEWRDLHGGDGVAPEDIMATVRAGRPWEGEWFTRRKDGSAYPVRGVISPVKHRDGSLACFVAVFDDVTEIKASEAELREARDAALAGDRAKGQFLATMSHEVRTPLNGIVGFTSLLLETPLNPEQREYVQTIRMSTEALIQLTGDILDFARIESGKLKLDPLACDPRECIEDALDLHAAKAAEKKIELLHRVEEGVPAAVLTDGGRLRQVLINLIGNAVKFTERGEVEVTVALAPERPARAHETGAGAGDLAMGDMCSLLFTVRDTGIGIPGEHHGKLFRPFTQVDESTTRRYGGTGLGLAISRNLVELMGGEIAVASEPGLGSSFSFTIRAAVAAPLVPNRDLAGLRLGLVIRSPSLRRELAAVLRGWQVTVMEAESAEGLVGAVWDTALIEVDVEHAQELAARAPVPVLPVERCLGLVPISLSNDLRNALRAHFHLLVNKPVHHDSLFGVLAGSRASVPPANAVTQFGFRVLVVEDNVINQRLIERVLHNLGCTATVLTNGREAVAELERRAADFDLMLLDLHMPEMDGITALREVRSGNAGPRAQAMWIIALTADAREQQRTRAMEAGLNDYLTKPLNLDELEEAFKKFRGERMARKR